MKINRTGNQYSEILDKVAQIIPEGISGGKPDFPKKDLPDVFDPETGELSQDENKYLENDVIGALTHAVQLVKAADYRAALKAIDKAKEMISSFVDTNDASSWGPENY